MEKRCSSCGKEKDLSLFVKYRGSVDGHHNQCKQCRRDFYSNNRERILKKQKEYNDRNKNSRSLRARKYRQTKHGRITQVLANIDKRCNNPTNNRYSRYGGRGIKHTLTYKDVEKLFDRDNGANMRKPSIDRIDNDGDYSFKNCRFVEFAENSIKDSFVKVKQIDDKDNVKIWNSISEAEKVGFQHGNIIKCCQGKRKTHGGFRWEYAD